MKAYIQIQNLKPHRETTSKVFNGANLTVELHPVTRTAKFSDGGARWYFDESEYIILGKEHDVKKPLSRF